MNVELLKRVKEKILQEPAQFIMSRYFARDGCFTVEGPDSDLERAIPNCGTAACIAGWAIALHEEVDPEEAYHRRTQEVLTSRRLYAQPLELSDEQAGSLFYLNHWPRHLQVSWAEADTLQERARVAAARIDLMIEEGRQLMYTERNFKTKKALKEAIAKGEKISVYQPGPFGGSEPKDGKCYLEGPHYPEPHKWYAQGELKDGYLVSVK